MKYNCIEGIALEGATGYNKGKEGRGVRCMGEIEKKNAEAKAQDQVQQEEPSGIKSTLGKVLFVVVLLLLITVVVICADAIINWITGLWS